MPSRSFLDSSALGEEGFSDSVTLGDSATLADSGTLADSATLADSPTPGESVAVHAQPSAAAALRLRSTRDTFRV